ncbi:MAG: CPBP family intramembrane glutamic endopeptidase [Bacteroidia bacterium]|nr:CPBP family intramembrane metalloprotease [Bacteroidia bacterium]MDW8334431.1 CPBP family intramembrane glutamic endopeptidase [Bacteroidia bacterium]
MKQYRSDSRKISYGIVMGGALFLLYEGLRRALMPDTGLDNGAAVWLKTLIYAFPDGPLYTAIAVLVVGAVLLVRDYKQGLRIRADFLALAGFESLFWALTLFFGLGWLAPLIVPPAELTMNTAPGSRRWIEDVIMSLGAGFYEELFFRLLLVGLLQGAFWFVGRDPQSPFNIVTVVLTASVLFSLAHFKFVIGEYGDDFSYYRFFFRTLFGVAMSALLVARGFGITAWAHALYDVLVFTVRAI